MLGLNWWKTACAVCVLCATTAIALRAQTFGTLLSFDSTDGAIPYAGLIQATDGNLYGTTFGGGESDACVLGCGTVFKTTPNGKLTVLHSFDGADGAYPYVGLVQGFDGNFYGTTNGGGADGYGTVFKITPGGTLTTLHTFGNSDGANPDGGLVQGTDGSFYGTTQYGGANSNDGTIFKITPSGTLTTLYSFCSQSGCADGAAPEAGLVQARDGNFYGTTAGGGTNDYGTVFQSTPSGALTALYRFCVQPACTDGQNPEAGLVQGVDGDFYGTTIVGGTEGRGTVFKITATGALTTLYSFCTEGNCADGENPGALIQGTDRSLYGTTQGGGNVFGFGTVFRITPRGALTTLYFFCSLGGCMDGASPLAGLVQDTSGTFYGTTYEGGVKNEGTVFSLSVSLGPFVETQPASGKAGGLVKILGTNLAGASSVTFNGTAATFTVESSSLIRTTVPAGATSGTVQVVTPHGTFASNVPFRVLP